MKHPLILFLVILTGCAYYTDIVKLPDLPIYNETEIINNTRYISLIKYCNYYNLDWNWDLTSQKIEIRRDDLHLVLRPNSNYILLNGKVIKLKENIAYKGGMAFVPLGFAAELADMLKVERITPSPYYTIDTIVLDPGHGGKDPGAIGRYGIKEKSVVLDLAKRLKKILEKKNLRVILTRDSDRFISLRKRTEFANNNNADLFISIHANASRYSRASGFEVYYLSDSVDDATRALEIIENKTANSEVDTMPNRDYLSATLWDLKLTENRRVSKELAYYICNVASDALDMKNRGVKGARFYVLKNTRMPAVLIEVGFLTNRRELSKLKKGYFREMVARAIAKSILEYKREYERTNGFSK